MATLSIPHPVSIKATCPLCSKRVPVSGIAGDKNLAYCPDCRKQFSVPLQNGQRITLAPNDATSTPRRVEGVLASYSDDGWRLIIGNAVLPVLFPRFAWHLTGGKDGAR